MADERVVTIPDMEEMLVDIMADNFERGETLEYSDRIQLVRQDRDRGLYSVFVDDELKTTIAADRIGASHLLRSIIDAIAQSGENDLPDEDSISVQLP